jgi:hypothetical protein
MERAVIVICDTLRALPRTRGGLETGLLTHPALPAESLSRSAGEGL